MDLRRLSPAALLLGAVVATGCITPAKPQPTDSAPVAAPAAKAANPNDAMERLRAFVAGDGLATTPAKPGQPARLTAAWQNKVIYAPDPTHGGEPVPGLMGKVWVFGPDDSVPNVPLSLEGEIFVGAWDNSPKANGAKPVLLEVWHIDAETAKKIRRKDFIGGEAYRLFLPWSQYHIDLKQINVVARFNGPEGRNVVSAPETLTLDHSATLQRAKEKLEGLSSGPVARLEAAGPAVLPLTVGK